ncbi:hypothetical protein BJ170DRAFT_424824 [Xylariales sp. AK1849]|nr:hypothetical protein BJ170DRAFT_424824 [Xylariales sp. AK1849]
MRELAVQSCPSLLLNLLKPCKALFRPLFGAAGLLPGIEQDSSWEAHGTNMSTQLFVGLDRVWFFWYEKLILPTQERIAYGRGDEEKFVQKWGHVHITDKLQLKEIYAARHSSGLTLVEEGMVEDWSWKRIIIVGDAVAKSTPNLASGLDGGVQMLTALMNGLHSLVKERSHCKTDMHEITLALTKYQAAIKLVSSKFPAASAEITRMCTWSTWKDWLMDRYVLEATNADWKIYHQKIGPMLAQGLVLNYLEDNNIPEGKIP